MRNDDPDARGEARGGAAAANRAAAVGRKRRKRKTRRSWSVEEKIRIARESLASGETITAVARVASFKNVPEFSNRCRFKASR